ncbi:MAG TPA: hypothetical protein EYN67_17820 [Flavobacteriales bacterium]|nr:hypothetical protein [Methylococcaceae bacterium]HHZ97353.1 hypothetical protein [Flavobacteriales bacterium]
MATIINNSLVAEESILRVHNPIFYVPDPDKGKPLDGFQAFFGIVGRDPLVEDNRKIVYALQEDGSAISLDQPVIGSAGGIPVHNNSPVGLAVNGSYSLKILDNQGVQKYYMPKVEAFNMQGFSGVIAEESQTVAGSQILTFAKIEATTAAFYKSTDATGAVFEGSYLKKDVDYTVDSTTQITLLIAAADGVVILGRQMDPTGQIVPVTEGSSALFVFQDIALAVASDLQAGDTVTINGGLVAGDKLGGNKYIAVFGQPQADDGENYINLSNGNQLQAIENNFKLARYAEVTTVTASVAGSLNIDLAQGNVHEIVLSENLAAINFVNVNPDADLTTTVTLRITQDPASTRTVNFAALKWAGGTVPVMTATLDAIDDYVFKSKGGSVWYGYVSGQDLK